MRLDLWLVKKGFFKTRSRAKIAIRMGLVKVNGQTVTRPSAEISEDAVIEILADKPAGYWKLRELDEKFRIFRGDETVLDLGSSAGGFLLYASERAKFVYGIEFSSEFEDILREIERERGNVRVFIEDAFRFDVERLESVDLILNDLTLPFSSSMIALKRFLSKLKPDGRILFVHKLGRKDNDANFAEFEILGFEKSRDKKEAYYFLRPKTVQG
jgi:23S rRNA (cytidine1920-2'-O)/16S rRNA (cytidine1409-2'-O)-methyltransferase